MLFHVVNERHLRRRSMIFTTNKALKQWGRVLHDDDLGDTTVDPVLERDRVLKLDGPSVRSKCMRSLFLTASLSFTAACPDRPQREPVQ